MSDAERTPQRFNESPALRDDQRGLQDAASSLQMASALPMTAVGMLLLSRVQASIRSRYRSLRKRRVFAYSSHRKQTSTY